MHSLQRFKSLLPVIVPAIPFMAWIVFLIWTSSLSSRSVVFFDALHQADVSGQYTSSLPPERYLLEPFAGFAFTLGKQIENSLVMIPIVYIIIRFVLAFIEKVVFRGSIKKDVLIQHARNVFNFYWKYAFLAFFVIFLVIITGMATTGALFLHQQFMSWLQFAFIAWLAMLCFKSCRMQRSFSRKGPGCA